MPGRDGTGPFGNGPVGRRLGPCFGNEPGYDQPFGFGMARRWGRRFGFGYGYGYRRPWQNWRADVPYRDEESDIQALQNQQNWLKEQLDAVTHEIENRQKPSE